MTVEEPDLIEEEGPDEDIIPEDEPAPRINWVCTGVAAGSLKRVAKEAHMMPPGAQPNQPTTDVSGTFMQGPCEWCDDHTIWKKVTL